MSQRSPSAAPVAPARPEPVRAVFLGTGGFAVPVVEALAGAREVVLVAVVTAPPRPAGRGHRPVGSPVAAWAARRGVPVLTPAGLRAPGSVAELGALDPGLLVLADYGRLVPQAILDLPRHGALNLHPSLLPRHRGASPVQAAIAAGDAETGVTLMRMDAGLDTGPIVAQRAVLLSGDETAPELEARLAEEAASLLRANMRAWLDGALVERPQPEEGATLTRPLRREDGRLDASRPAVELARLVRAYRPWPGTWLETEGGRLAVHAAQATHPPDDGPGQDVGRLVADGDGLALVTGDGWLHLLEVQPPGGRRMSAAAYRRGRPAIVGSRVQPPSVG
ncbi:MAG TPA: methionyl-tRNA formyltransferase [Candidatus Limnocylindrales bacterium]|nr:methionyl-tRNA formyltransferase [Candidatus Limnocylindrales bacterium]